MADYILFRSHRTGIRGQTLSLLLTGIRAPDVERFVLLRNHANGAAMQPTLCCEGPFASSFPEIADYAVSGTTAPCTTYTRYVGVLHCLLYSKCFLKKLMQ